MRTRCVAVAAAIVVAVACAGACTPTTGEGEAGGEGEGTNADGCPDAPCPDGSACIPVGDTPDGNGCAVGCAPLPARAGDVCHSVVEDTPCSGFQFGCPDGTRCVDDADIGDITGTCVGHGTSNLDESCVLDDDCAAGLFCLSGANGCNPCPDDSSCSGGTCAPFANDGDACSTAATGCTEGLTIECAPGFTCFSDSGHPNTTSCFPS